jgi:four helix bundle protein
VTAQRFQDLVIWRIASDLRDEVYRLTSTPAVARDLRFRDQIRASAASISANIAEGFGRGQPRDFARFLRIAAGSAAETQNWLADGCARGYWHRPDIEHASHLLAALERPLRNLIRYLDNCPKRPMPK